MTAIDDALADIGDMTPFGNPGFFRFENLTGFNGIGLKFGGNSTNMVLGNCFFQYTVIGRECFFFLNWEMQNKGTAVGTATMNMGWANIAQFGFMPFSYSNAGFPNVTREDIPFKVESVNMTGFILPVLEVTNTGFALHAIPVNGARTLMTNTFFASPSSFSAAGYFAIQLSA